MGLGQTLIFVHALPWSYYTFPMVWYGYILAVDGVNEILGGTSLLAARRVELAWMIPLSAAFWWLFEWFNLAVHNWRYVGGSAFTGISFVALASLCFSTVIPAVWETVGLVMNVQRRLGRSAGIGFDELLGGDIGKRSGRGTEAGEVNNCVLGRPTSGGAVREFRMFRPLLIASVIVGIVCIGLPIFVPHYAYGLIWIALFFLVDPINGAFGQPSLLVDAARRVFSTAATFAVSALVCGLLWEFWNYWAVMKWVYIVPLVPPAHLFEMPLAGYLGYLPFGLEVYAVTVFGLRTLPAIAYRAMRTTAPRAKGQGFFRQ
jgi:hypothetical protein